MFFPGTRRIVLTIIETLSFPSGLQANTLDLEVRVGNLEENSGDNGNSSIAELELRVETLEDVTAEQETRIVTAEENIQGSEFFVSCQERFHFKLLFYKIILNSLLTKVKS